MSKKQVKGGRKAPGPSPGAKILNHNSHLFVLVWGGVEQSRADVEGGQEKQQGVENAKC